MCNLLIMSTIIRHKRSLKALIPCTVGWIGEFYKYDIIKSTMLVERDGIETLVILNQSNLHNLMVCGERRVFWFFYFVWLDIVFCGDKIHSGCTVFVQCVTERKHDH